MAPRRQNVPMAELVRRAQAQLAPPSGIRTGGEQFLPPELHGERPGYPGSAGIGAPGMRVGDVPPEIDKALLQEAIGTGWSGGGGMQLPAAAQPPQTRDELELGIDSPLVPGSSPYLPHQSVAPSMAEKDPYGMERFKAMNFSMTPVGMRDHFRNLGFEAEVAPHDKFAKAYHPMMEEIVSGEGYNVIIKEPTTGDWHTLDPQSFELADLTDIASDAAITVASIMGANAAGAAAATGRQTAVHSARQRALAAATGPLDDAMKAAGGAKHLIREAGEEAVDTGIRRATPAVHALRSLEEAAATPSTFLGPRVAGAVKWTVPPEAARQGIGALTDVPEEGGGRRLGRGLMELGASGIGELADPFMGAKGLIGAGSRGKIKKWLKARDFAEKYDKPFTEPPPRAFEDILAPEETLASLRQRMGGRPIEAVDDVVDDVAGGTTGTTRIPDDYQGAFEGRTVQSLLPGQARGGQPSEGPTSRWPGRHQFEGDWTYDSPLEISNEMRNRINAVLEKEGTSYDTLSVDDQRMIYEQFQELQGGKVGDEDMTPTGFFRNPDTLDDPIPSQPQSEEGVLARIMSRGAEAQSGDSGPTGKQGSYAQKAIDNKRQHWTKLEGQDDPPDPKVRAQQEGVFKSLEGMDEGESFWIEGLVEMKPTVVMRDGQRVSLGQGQKVQSGDQVVGGVQGWQALDEGNIESLAAISRNKQHMVRLAPTFLNKTALKANLDSADGLADISKMDWADVVIAADDWRFDAKVFKGSKDWDEAFDGSDGEQVFRYMLDHMDDTDHGDPLTAIEPPDVSGRPTYDPEDHDGMWLWADISEWGTSKEGPGRRRGWVFYKTGSIEVLGREHVTGTMPAPAHSTRPLPAVERYAAEARPYEETLAEVTPKFSPEGRVATDKPSKELSTVKQLVAKGKKLKKVRGKADEYKERLDRLAEEQASRYEAFVASEKAWKARNSRKKRPDPADFPNQRMQEGDPIEQSAYDIYYPGSSQVYKWATKYKDLQKGPLKRQATDAHQQYHKTESTPKDPLEDTFWAEDKQFASVKTEAAAVLRDDEALTELGFSGMGLTQQRYKIEGWSFRGEGSNHGMTMERAIEIMGGAYHPGFTDKKQGAAELVYTMLNGTPSPAWSAHIWAPELRGGLGKQSLNDYLKDLLDDFGRGSESFFRDYHDPDNLLGTAADEYARYRGFIKDLMLMWRTTPKHISRETRAEFMIEQFYNPHHQTGLYQPGSGLFDVLSRDYDAFDAGEGGLYHWFAGNLRSGSADAVNMGRDTKRINEIKAFHRKGLVTLGYGEKEARTRVDNAVRILGDQHPDLEKDAVISRVALNEDGNVLPSGLKQANGEPWNINKRLNQVVPQGNEAIVKVQRAHEEDINRIPGQDMLDSFARVDTEHGLNQRPPELRHRLKYLGWDDAEIDKVGSGAEGAMTHEGAYVRANFGIKKGSQLDTNLKAHEADPNTPFRTEADGDQPDPRDGGGDADGGGEQQQQKQGQGRGDEEADGDEPETDGGGDGDGDGGGKKKETKEEKKARLAKEKKKEAEKKKKDDKEDEEPDETDDGGGDDPEPEGPRDPGDMDTDEINKEIDDLDISDDANEERFDQLLDELRRNTDKHPGEYEKTYKRIFGSETEFAGGQPEVKLHPDMQQPPAGGEVAKKPKGMSDKIWELGQRLKARDNEEDILVRGGGEGEESYVTLAHVRGEAQAAVNVYGHKTVTVVEKGSLERDVAFFDTSHPGVSLDPVQVARLAGHKSELTTEGTYIDYGSGQGVKSIQASGGWQSGWIHEGGPLWNAGVRRGDFVYSINGKTPTGHEGMRRLMTEAFKKKGPIEIFLIRSVDGKAKKYKTTFELSDTDVWREPKRPEVRLREETEAVKADKLDTALKAWDDGDEEIEIGLIGGILPHSYLSAAAALKGPGEYSGRHKIKNWVINTTHPALGVAHPELRSLRIRMEGWEQGATREPVHLRWKRGPYGGLAVAHSTAWKQKSNFGDPLTGKKSLVLERNWDLKNWGIGQVLDLIDAPYLFPAVPVEVRQLAAWSLDDLKALYKKVHGLDWLPEKKRRMPAQARAFMSLQWETGLRMNELLKLSEEDFRAFTPEMLKNSRALQDVHDMLVARKGNRPKKDATGRTPLFVNKKNARAKASTARSYYTDWQVEVKKKVQHGTRVYKNTSHAMRHSVATHMMDMGADISVAKELLGHAEAKRWVKKRTGSKGDATWHMTRVYTEHHRGLTTGERWMAADEPMTLASREGPRLTGATAEGATPDWEPKTFTIEQMTRIRASEHLSKDSFSSKRNKAMLETQYSTGLRNDGLMGRPNPVSEEGKKFKGLQVEDFLNLTAEELKVPALKAIHEYLPYRKELVQRLAKRGHGHMNVDNPLKFKKYMEAKVDSGPLFINSKGNRFGHKSYTNMLQKVTGEERAWPTDVKHPIRHAWATHLIDQSEDLVEIEKFLKAGDIEDLADLAADGEGPFKRRHQAEWEQRKKELEVEWYDREPTVFTKTDKAARKLGLDLDEEEGGRRVHREPSRYSLGRVSDFEDIESGSMGDNFYHPDPKEFELMLKDAEKNGMSWGDLDVFIRYVGDMFEFDVWNRKYHASGVQKPDSLLWHKWQVGVRDLAPRTDMVPKKEMKVLLADIREGLTDHGIKPKTKWSLRPSKAKDSGELELSLFKEGDRVVKDGVEYEVVSVGGKYLDSQDYVLRDLTKGAGDDFVDFAPETVGFKKSTVEEDLVDKNNMLLASHVFRATGKNPGSIVIVDRAIKALQGYVDKGHMSQSFFKKLYESYIGSKTGKGGSKKILSNLKSTRVRDFVQVASEPGAKVENVHYVTEQQFKELGDFVMEHVNATKASLEGAEGRLDISKAFDEEIGLEAGEHLLLDSMTAPGDERYVRVDTPAENLQPTDIKAGVDIIYRLYPEQYRSRYGKWGGYEGDKFDRATGEWIKPEQPATQAAPEGAGIPYTHQDLITVGNIIAVQPGGRSSLGHRGTQVFFQKGQSYYRAFFVDPGAGPGVKATGYLEILVPTAQTKTKLGGVKEKYHRVGTILATGKELTDYSPGGARAGGVPDQLRLHPGEDATPGVGPRNIPVAARRHVWRNEVLAPLESFKKGHYQSLRLKIAKSIGSREELIGMAKEILEGRRKLVGFLEAMQRGFKKEKPTGPGKTSGFSRAESDAAEAAGKPWSSPHAVSVKLGAARHKLKATLAMVDELEGSVTGLATISDAKKVLKKDLSRATLSAIKGIKESITDLRVVSVGEKIRVAQTPGKPIRVREDHVLYRLGTGAWQIINRSDYENLSLRGMKPVGQLAWDDKKIDKEFVALLHLLGRGTNFEGESVSIAKPYRGYIGFEKGAQVIEHGRKPVLGPFRLTRGATYSEPGGMRIAEQVGGQRRADDPTHVYTSGTREDPTRPEVVERGVGGGVVRREIEEVKVIDADPLYRQEGRVRVLEEHEQSYVAGEEYVAILRTGEPRKVKTSRGFAKSGQPGRIEPEVFDIVDELRARHSNWDNMKPQTRIKLFNEEYYGGGWASHTDKGVDPDVAWTQRPDVDRDYVTTGRLPDYQANYGQSDYIWYKYDRKEGVVQAAIDKGELPPPEYRVGGAEGHKRPPMPYVLDARVRSGELIHSGTPEAPWNMSFHEFFSPSAMWRGDAPTSKFVYEGRGDGGQIPDGAWERGKVDVSIRAPGFSLDFELDISPIKKITGKGKLKRSRQHVSDEDLARLAWEKLQNKRFRDKVGATEAAKPIEDRPVSSFTIEEYESLLIRRTIEIEERAGIMPHRPRVDMDASGKSVRVTPHFKSKQTINPEINPYLHYEALLYLSGKGDFVGEGVLDAATRKSLMTKGGKDWGLLGVPSREGDTRSFLMQTLEERGLIDGKGKLTTKIGGGKDTLEMWHAQQLAYDKRMGEIRATVKEGLPAKMADHINAELTMGKAKMSDLDANLIRELAVRHEHIVGAEHVRGLIPVSTIKKVRSKTTRNAQVKMKLGIEKGQAQTVFKYDKKLMSWADENGKSVDDIIRELEVKSRGAKNQRALASFHRKIDKLIELRDNLEITPIDQIAYRQPLPIARGGKPAAAGDLLKGADLDVPFGEGRHAVVTRHEDGKFSYAVFSSYSHAKSYQSMMAPLEGDAVGGRRLFSDIIRGREDWTLKQALEAADYITAGTPLKKSQDYQGVNAQIERHKFRAVQMADAATDLNRQIFQADELYASDPSATITIKLPRWEAKALGIESAPGKPDKLRTSLKYKPGTYSEGIEKVAQDDYWDATATGYRTYTATGEEEVDALIDKAITRYNTLVSKEMPDVADDLHTMIGKRTGTKQPVGETDRKTVVLGGDSQKRVSKSRETLNIDRETGRVIEEGKLRPLGDQLKDKADEATGGFANVSALLGVSLVGAVAATVGDVGGEIFQGMADGVATFLKTAFLQVTGDGAITFKQSMAGLATGGFVLAEGLGKSLKDVASRSTKKAKGLLVGLRDKVGNILQKLPPEDRARGMKTTLEAETPGQRQRREKRHIGRLVGDEATEVLKSVDNDIFEFPRSNEGMVSRWTPASEKDFDLSKHSANPIKVPIIPKHGVVLNARNAPPYDQNSTELRMIITDATTALVRDGWTVTEATWGATFKNKRGVKMRGLIISKPGVVTPTKVQQHIDRAWDAAAHRVWDAEGIKLHQEAEEILNDLPQEYREAFITWWQHERGAQDPGLHNRYTGVKQEYKFWKAVSDYSTGRKTLKFARRSLPGRKHQRFAMSSEYGPHTVPKEKTLLYRSYDEVMRREAPDIEYRKPTKGEADELDRRETEAADRSRDDYVDPLVESWVDEMMRSIDGLDTEKGRALARAMRMAEHPELHGMIKGRDMEAKYINFKLLNGGEQQKIRKAFMDEMEKALKEFLDSPEGDNWQTWLHGLSQKLHGFSDASKGLIGKGAWRNIQGVLRFARAFWRGSRLSSFGRFMWKVDAVKQASRSLAKIFHELATEPNRAKARALFMESGDLLGRIPDKIKRGLGLPPFEEEYARNMTKNVPLNWVRWAARRMGVDMPTGMQRKGLDTVIGRGTGPGVAGARETVSRVTGAKPSGVVGSSRPRIGGLRYRDRPVIKEAMQRRERIMSEKREKKKKRELRLPRKLQRSS